MKLGLALPALAFLALIAGTQSCTLVGDNITGVRLQRAAPSTCVGQCNNLYNESLKLELERFATEREACLLLEGEERSECIRQGAERHGQAILELNDDRKECMTSCHRQGNGFGG